MKKKLSFIIWIVLSSQVIFSQNGITNLSFDTKFYDAVNQWVAFNKRKSDSSFAFGYIFLDGVEGFKFNYYGRFKIIDEKYLHISEKGSKYKGISTYKLSKKTPLISKLKYAQRRNLKLEEKPSWLKSKYKYPNSTKALIDKGYQFNLVGAYANAKTCLLKAYEKKPHHKHLEYQLSWAYNGLGKYQIAKKILEKAIKFDRTNYYLHRELGKTYMNLNQVQNAEKYIKKSFSLSSKKYNYLNSSSSLSITEYYYKTENREKFDQWAMTTRRYAEKNSWQLDKLKDMEENWYSR